MCKEYNHFIDHNEILLSILLLKTQPSPLPLATNRLNELKEYARKLAGFLQGIVDKLAGPKK
jgi:hypothetical protein